MNADFPTDSSLIAGLIRRQKWKTICWFGAALSEVVLVWTLHDSNCSMQLSDCFVIAARWSWHLRQQRRAWSRWTSSMSSQRAECVPLCQSRNRVWLACWQRYYQQKQARSEQRISYDLDTHMGFVPCLAGQLNLASLCDKILSIESTCRSTTELHNSIKHKAILHQRPYSLTYSRTIFAKSTIRSNNRFEVQKRLWYKHGAYLVPTSWNKQNDPLLALGPSHQHWRRLELYNLLLAHARRYSLSNFNIAIPRAQLVRTPIYCFQLSARFRRPLYRCISLFLCIVTSKIFQLQRDHRIAGSASPTVPLDMITYDYRKGQHTARDNPFETDRGFHNSNSRVYSFSEYDSRCLFCECTCDLHLDSHVAFSMELEAKWRFPAREEIHIYLESDSTLKPYLDLCLVNCGSFVSLISQWQ